MENRRIRYLFEKYLSNDIRKDELEEFLEFLDRSADDVFDSLVDEMGNTSENSSAFDQNQKDRLHDLIRSQIDVENPRPIRRFLSDRNVNYLKPVAAVLFVGVLAALVYFSVNPTRSQAPIVAEEIRLPVDVAPQIIHPDGKSIRVNPGNTALLAQEGLSVEQSAEGEHIYKVDNALDASTKEQTFLSPKGASLQLQLSDGTRVWLNSGARITYPTVFATGRRTVSVQGEAYFEVSENPNKPFIITMGHTQVKVLGTAFNMAADSAQSLITTTLVEGVVEVSSSGQSKKLEPGYSSISDRQANSINIVKADIKQALAWKEGYFRFNDDDINTVLNKIGQWYNIESIRVLRYTDDRFSGMVKRSTNLTDLLRNLEKTSAYKFEIRKGGLVVM